MGSVGGVMRNWIQATLSLACALRGLALFRLVWSDGVMSSYLVIPDLAFLGTYSLIALFMAQLHFVYVGRPQGRLRPIFLSAVASVLSVSFVMCIMRWRKADPASAEADTITTMLSYVMAISYVSVLVPLAYFGVQTSKAAHRSNEVFRPLVLLIATCSLALLIKGTFFALAASNTMCAEVLFHTPTARLYFEGSLALDELVPALTILLLTRSKAQLHQTPASARYPFEGPGLTGGGKNRAFGNPSNSHSTFTQLSGFNYGAIPGGH
ncbi:unnamed protein product [Choristocarpus tenellus]